ncbi:MAG TPA: DUF2182 domain-containing protein [Pseudonocardia sp.]|nr:DUF2182 domain-containing protein [Pseudonocardia sp.]
MATPAAPPVRDPAVGLWAAAGMCWFATAWLLLLAGDGAGHHAGSLEGSTWPWTLRAGAFLAGWLVMVGAMMLPTVVPLVRLFAVVSARAPRPGPARAALLAGYLAVWTAFAAVALVAATGLAGLVGAWSWLAARPAVVLGAALVLAGAFQFSTLKQACLTACRSPALVLHRHYRRGAAGGLRLGLRHGLHCLGCCWALMLLMVVAGAASLYWMLALTAVMVAEKTTRGGARLARPVGVALIVAGITLAATDLVGSEPVHTAAGHGHGADPGTVALLVAGAVLGAQLIAPAASRRRRGRATGDMTWRRSTSKWR